MLGGLVAMIVRAGFSSRNIQPMGITSSSPQPPPPSAQDKALLDLKIQRDKLIQYQKRVNAVISRETEVAKQHLVAGDKRRALLALKKKKYQTSLLDKTDQQLINLEQLTQTIEFKLVESTVMESLKQGTVILQKLNQEMRLEDVDKLMADTEDALAYQREVDEALSQKIGEQGEEEVLAELEALEAASSTEMELEMPKVPVTAPSVATTTSPKRVATVPNKTAAEPQLLAS
jgi:charged multivesicular body protein 6